MFQEFSDFAFSIHCGSIDLALLHAARKRSQIKSQDEKSQCTKNTDTIYANSIVKKNWAINSLFFQSSLVTVIDKDYGEPYCFVLYCPIYPMTISKMALVDTKKTQVDNFVYLRDLCVYIFEGNVWRSILDRWFLYAPAKEESLQYNIDIIIKSICLSNIRLEIAPTHVQIFDCEFLKIPSQILKDYPIIIQLIQRLFPYFSRSCVDRVQCAVFLRGYTYDGLLETIICRESLLASIVNKIYADSIRANALPQMREMVENIFTDLYTQAEGERKSMIGHFIIKLKPNSRQNQNQSPEDEPFPSIYRLKKTIPILQSTCILSNETFCPNHSPCSQNRPNSTNHFT